MFIKIKEIAKKAGVKGPDLLTRPLARKIYKAAKRKLQNIIDGETVVCDFEDIEVIDPSFVDEFLVRLIREGISDKKKYFIRIKNLSESGELNITSVFESYEAFSKLRLLVVTEDLTSKNSYVIGKLNTIENSVVELLRINGYMKNEKIASVLGVSAKKTDSILNSMAAMRIVKTENGVYELV